MSSFEITTKSQEGFLVLQVNGYLNAEAGEKVNQLIDSLLQEKQNKIIFDFSNCKVVNSPGIAAIIDLVYKIQDDFHGKLFLTGLDALKINVFSSAGINRIVDIVPAVSDAIDKLRIV